MPVAVLGTGMVGRSIAGRLEDLGHEVVVGTRDPAATLARSEPDQPFSAWTADHPGVRLATFAEAAKAAAELVVLAGNGAGALDVLARAGEANLDGKIVVDVTNPLDFSAGVPPTLFVKDTDSLGERLQRAYPGARVVKTLNTMNATLMADPELLAGGDHSVFVSGDDATAKARVTELLQSFGHADVIDLGDITTARGAEMFVGFWLRLWGAAGTPMFNIKVVR
ncbi:NADPH-dependent F420 reductase [Jiangella asiatica]|uniref:NADP oxidoreductase n=1 Tax=Jiangella asiatica TaxID=2530372 RepID=A0A4R5CP38_9ACTN|nr:NAD(P)-binding domain-containing protein [Jiangella asiatica]TDE02199.1 NADP oxidoreductase [Jiangella asiatica]